MSRPVIDLSGQTFGRLTVIQLVEVRNKRSYWECVCSCPDATRVTVRSDALRSTVEPTRSCGCLQRELVADRARRHGDATAHARSPEYTAWGSMKQRCQNPKNPMFENYGARGIRVCDRWRNSYEAFLADMGRKPDQSLTIDRIDNDGDYEPGNCRWATMAQQNANTRSTRLVTVEGITHPINEWARLIGVSARTLRRLTGPR